MAGWWGGRIRQFRRYVGGRVSDAERRDLAAWLTPAQLALFDGMHRADQRHGLDVVAALRAEGHRDPELLLAGLFHDAAKGTDRRLWPRVFWALGDHYGRWIHRVPRAGCRASPTPSTACATTPSDRPSWRWQAGCSAATAELIRHQAEPVDPTGRRGAAPGRRGQLMTIAARRRGPDSPPRRRPARAAPSVRASITFDHDARPERAALVQLEGSGFEGPLALLLSLIEQRQLDVLDVPLGELAGAYLEAISRLPAAQMPHISAFITVSAQLILIKSRAILPRPPAMPVPADEGMDPEAELRQRLLVYKRYRDAAARLGERLSTGNAAFHREAAAALAAARAGARAPQGPPLDAQLLADALAAAFRLAPAPVAAARGAGALGHAGGARRDHPPRAAPRAAGGAPGPAARRPRSGRGGHHVPGHAGAGQGPRGDRRAGGAVGPDRLPRRCGRRTARWSRCRSRPAPATREPGRGEPRRGRAAR